MGIPQICGFHSYGDPYFGRAYSSIFSTVFGTCSTDLHTDFAHRKSMKLHRFLMCTIFHIHNVTVVASVVIQFDTKIRNNQHIYNTLLVNTTTSVLFAGTRPCRYSDHPAPQPYKRPSMLTMVAALALVQGRGRWPPTYGPGR